MKFSLSSILLTTFYGTSSLKIQEITVPTQRTDVTSSTDSAHVWKRHFVEQVQDTAVQGRRRRRRRTAGKPKITGVVLTSDVTSFQDAITMKVVYTFDKSAIFGTATGTPFALVHTSVADSFGAIPLPYASNSNGAPGSTTARQTFEQTFRSNSFTYTHSSATTDSFSLGGNSLILNGATTDADVTHSSTLGTTTVTITHGHCANRNGFTANTLFPCFCGETLCQSDKTFCEMTVPSEAADRLCTTIPICEYATGLQTSIPANHITNCYCGTSTCSVSTSTTTGWFCTKATNFCAPTKTCADETRLISNAVTDAEGDCRCGSNICSDASSNYCDGSSCQTSPACTNTANTISPTNPTLPCACGTADCDSSNVYCDAAANSCGSEPICLGSEQGNCKATGGLTCSCGGTSCSLTSCNATATATCTSSAC